MQSKIFSLAFLGLVFMSSCNKDPKQDGCTDPTALNYDASALKDDGSCEFNQKEQIIWQSGLTGGWNGDLIEGAYSLNVCEGVTQIMTEEIDSLTTTETLYLGTGADFKHKSYFTLINEHDARDFAEGSLRFDARVLGGDDGSPDFIKLFISGKIADDGNCDSYRRSEYVEISTQSFNDSTFTPVNITIREFEKIMMARVQVVCGMEFDGERNTGIEIDNLRWVATFNEEQI
ncbi:MAG: hypothetical protein MK086_02390 [Flavobacteriales bacterium]|nr:hypothetical protein [Flavobacteriales bacterium]